MSEEKLAALEQTIRREYPNLAGLVVRKDGAPVYESYFGGCTAASTLHIYSVTKSVVSLLTGIALDKGCLEGLDQKILEFFPEYPVKKGEKTLGEIRLRDMLTMTAPYKYRMAPYVKYFTSDDWVRFSLDLLGGRGRIGKFRYAPLIGPDVLCGILQRATGQTVLHFAQEQLFAPLGITVAGSVTFRDKEEQLAFNQATDISGWVADAQGVNAAGWGLTLTATDMAKLGQLCLDGGVWQGRRLISEQWLRESTTEHSRWNKLAYGYLWWVLDGNGPVYAAMGDGGNVIYVNAGRRLVVAVASRFAPRAKDRLALIRERIEPLFAD